MSPPTKHAERQPQDGGSGPRDDQLQSQANGYIARHPTLARVLQWLGWNNPGASMNP
jgi:hypothetical protein